MKKVILSVVIVCAAVFAQAATVGWSLAGAANFAGDAYMFFIDGQNGASIAAVTAALDAGNDVSTMAFGSGVVAANGTASVTAGASGKTLDAGTYTGFYVVFDADSPVAGSANYAVVSGAATLTKTIAGTTASVSFASGNASSTLNDTANWKSFGEGGGVPEPTSGLLLLVGGALLALRRKQK